MTLRLKSGLGTLMPVRTTASADPLPFFSTGAKIITVGDSIMQANNYANNSPFNKISNQGDGIITWALRDIPAFQHLVWQDSGATGGAAPPYFYGANFGLSGDSATQVAARTTPMVNSGADLAIVLVGTNTGATDALVATTIASIQDILDDLIGTGMHVILGTILPRETVTSPTGNQISLALMDRIQSINDWIRVQGSADITVWDAWDDLVDPQYEDGVDDEYGSPLAGMTKDGVHLTPVGAYTAAQSLRSILQQMTDADLFDDTWFESDPADSANRITNGSFTGTSGYPQYGVSGTVAANWVVRSTDTSPSYTSGVASLVANADTGGYSQKLVITCDGLGATDGYEQYYMAPLSNIINEPAMTDGNWVQLMFKFRVENNDDGILGSLTGRLLNQTQGKNSWGMEWVNTFQAEPWPVTDFEGWIVTEPLQYSTGNVFQIYLYANIMENFAGTVDVYCDAAVLLEVADPDLTFPYTP